MLQGCSMNVGTIITDEANTGNKDWINRVLGSTRMCTGCVLTFPVLHSR